MKVLFRADASAGIGTGHVMRCLAFGQAVNEAGGDCSFVVRSDQAGIVDRIRREGFGVRELTDGGDPAETLSLLSQEHPDWVVLDGYAFGIALQQAVVSAGYRLLVIDDLAHLDRYHADAVLNQNAGAERLTYRTPRGTRLLLGPQYAVLRREFRRFRDAGREFPSRGRNLLVTMGGSDPANATRSVLAALDGLNAPMYVRAVVGAANPHLASLHSAVEQSRHRIEVLTGVEEMAPLMAWADLAISAGGSTVWELACLGVPSLLCIIAQNQEPSVQEMERQGLCHSLGWLKDRSARDIASAIEALACDQELRRTLSARSRAFVDGQGVGRIISALQELSAAPRTWLLKADLQLDEVTFTNFINLDEAQRELVRTWRNRDEIRKWMFTERIIAPEEHRQFIDRLKDGTASAYWMAAVNSRPSGVVSFQRIDLANRSGYLGIYTVEQGMGRSIMRQFVRLWFDLLGMQTLRCEVREGNDRAYAFYTSAGFRETGRAVHALEGTDKPARILELVRPSS
ncbi:MAG: UDP-2,4-diacetamido-2,4,6-trideoxy-beta-L-altropyranose hydrolase [Nitrospirota bacterium]